MDLSSAKLTINVNERVHLYSTPTLETLKLGSLYPNVFPTFIFNLTHLKQLNLSYSSLMGAIPCCISELKNLLYLDLSNNKLHGPLPLLPQGIYHSDLSQNKLDGDISLEAGERLSSARNIILNGNELSGTIPSSICSPGPRKTYDQVFIDLSNNKLSGIIPFSIGFCRFLWYLNLGNNNLSGNVPNEFQQVESLQYLQLSYNNLNGLIPYGFGSSSNLRILSLRSNKFNGSIPEGIYQIFFLQILDLSKNNFSGSISRGISNLMMLRVRTDIDGYICPMQNGKMQFQLATKGSVAEFDDLYQYSSGIDLSCNILDGKIPREISSLNGLAMLNLSHNFFSNNIPSNIGDMSKLESLDLSFNRLSGDIPQSLTNIDSLGFLSLSHNNLSGRIPRGNHFDTYSLEGSTFSGNDLLCGFPTKKDCEGDSRGCKTEDIVVCYHCLRIWSWVLEFVLSFASK
ncbi:receptor-like protein EIX2 [Papaver somniferum]|uniref:receptor-like protein EIX2 n=1 Tax=Papaver somniferum TaxID=3469 RepID=UPI000E702114|nr:receptor-like protein EIX2 [Papaver somniferum]